MKKYVLFSVMLFLSSLLFSQKTTKKDSSWNDREWKSSIEKQDREEREKAKRNPIVKRIYDTLGADYLEQHFYHNGNLYYQVPFKNGKQNGLREHYHPNGQLECERVITDGVFVFDTCTYIAVFFDRFGDLSRVSFYAVYNKKLYDFCASYAWGDPSFLMIYDGRKLVAEFRYSWWSSRKWKKHDYHCRSVKYAKKLLRVYKKRCIANNIVP
jgi:antitoxin component YwqK of YwqJK toxin-antitoxin module